MAVDPSHRLNNIRQYKTREFLIENQLSKSMSVGVICCVPEIHCIFDIVGLGGTIASMLKSLSRDRVLKSNQDLFILKFKNTYRSSPVPQTLRTTNSDGPAHPKMSPVGVIIASGNLLTLRI